MGQPCLLQICWLQRREGPSTADEWQARPVLWIPRCSGAREIDGKSFFPQSGVGCQHSAAQAEAGTDKTALLGMDGCDARWDLWRVGTAQRPGRGCLTAPWIASRLDLPASTRDAVLWYTDADPLD